MSIRIDDGRLPRLEQPSCRNAVGRCYGRMIEVGLSRACALDAAARVYRHHHPEASYDLARLIVEGWIGAGPPAGEA